MFARLLLAAAALFAGGCAVFADEAAPGPVDLLAFSNGGLVEKSPPSYGGGWEAIWLIDEDAARGWASQQNATGPFEFVFSLAERSRLEQVSFSTAAVEKPEESAKDVEVLVSDQSATAGFASVGKFKLEQATDGQRFALPSPATGRWVKIVVHSNYGAADYTEIMDMQGFGVALSATPPGNVSGTYDSEAYGKFHLQQTGTQLSGCYEHQKGLVQGGLESQLMRLTWTENGGDENAAGGPVVMVMNRDGRGFQGLWRRDDDPAWSDNWKLRKVSDEIGSCPHWKPAGTKGASNIVATQLAAQGRVRLYGINFDTDSDKLRSDSKPALDQVVAALKANAGWKILVEGHTDSSGGAAHNLDLSNRRSLSVKAYLAAAGLVADRIGNVGFGQDKPVASNDSALGRAQNRRVEVVKQ